MKFLTTHLLPTTIIFALASHLLATTVINSTNRTTTDIESRLSISSEPQKTSLTSRGESLEIEFLIKTKFTTPATLSYAITTVSDHGSEALPMVTQKVHLGPAESATTIHTIPDTLTDGYYSAWLHAAAIDQEFTTETADHAFYFAIGNGSVIPLTIDDYYEHSSAGEGWALNPSIEHQPLACPIDAECCPPLPCIPPPDPPSSSGYIQGTLSFVNKQGAYCPNTGDNGNVPARACAGSRYLESDYLKAWPIREVRIRIKRADTDAIIGSGTTDSNGAFRAFWQIASSVSSLPVRIEFELAHKDNRFKIWTHDGAYVHFRRTSPITAYSGQTTHTPPLIWGTTNTPDPFINIYDGAWRTWDILRTSNRMLIHFNDIEIRALGTGGNCTGSCSIGNQSRIYITEDRKWKPTVAHEIGHVVSDKSSRDQFIFKYTDYSRDGVAGHSYNTPEYGAPSFEEGFANFIAVARDYDRTADQPTLCNGDGACYSNWFNIEASSTLLPEGCAEEEGRWEISTTRYLWDLYDLPADGTDSTSLQLYQIIDGLHAFLNGTGEDQKEEPFLIPGLIADDKDGRSGKDYRDNMALHGIDTTDEYLMNCSPVGD